MILLSARDPQAAEIVATLYQSCLKATEPLVIAEAPATGILRQHAVPFTAWQSGTRHRQHLPQLLRRLDKLLPAPGEIDWILTGLSGPGWGIDELLICWAKQKGVPTIALQSWWGDVNPALGCLADAFIVRDATAARLTRRRAPASLTVEMSPWPFPVTSAEAPQAATRPCLQFYTQPLRMDLTCLTLQTLAQTLQMPIWIKPHPKTDSLQRARLTGCVRKLNRQGAKIRLGEASGLCAIQATLFSTMLERLAHQIGHAPGRRPPSMWFIQTHPMVRRMTRSMTHMQHLPFQPPVYEVIEHAHQLKRLARISMLPSNRLARARAMHALAPDRKGLCEMLEKSIQRALDAIPAG